MITGCGKDGFGKGMAGANRETSADKQQRDGGRPILPGVQFPPIGRVIERVAEGPEILDRPIESAAKKIAEEVQVKSSQAQPPYLEAVPGAGRSHKGDQ